MKKSDNFVGVILAAGQGSRITPLNLEYPKPLLPVCNKPIMEYQIEEMKKLGIKKIFIVIGYFGEKIQKYFKNGKKWQVEITYIKQKKRLGIAHAVGQLEPLVKSPFLLFLGDIFYVPKNLSKLLTTFKKYNAGAVLAVKKEKDQDSIKRNFSLETDSKGLVKRVIEKPRYVVNNLKGCGIYLFDLPIFDAIRNTPRTAMRDEYEITTAIQLLIDYGYLVFARDVVKWDMNITFASDLLSCNLAELKRKKQNNLIGNKVIINKLDNIENSVIGDRVKILSNIKIKNSIILPRTIVSQKTDIINSLYTPKSMCLNGRIINTEK